MYKNKGFIVCIISFILIMSMTAPSFASGISSVGADESVVSKTSVKASVAKVSLNMKRLTLLRGESSVLTATIDPNEAKNGDVTWESSNTSVATVDKDGEVVGIKAGNATITATTIEGKKKATCSVTVTIPKRGVTGVKLNFKNTVVARGSSRTLIATVSPTNAKNKGVTWSSSDPSVATVDSKGKVKGIDGGIVYIIATTKDGNIKAICTVTVMY